MRGRHAVISAALLLFGPLAAWSQPRSRIAVVPPGGDAPAVLAERAAVAVAAEAVTTGRDVVRPAVPLQEVLLTIECPESSDGCMAVAGHSLGVQELLLTLLWRKGAGWRVEYTLFDVVGARVVRRVERRFAAEPRVDELARLGRAVFQPAAPPAPDPAGKTGRGGVKPAAPPKPDPAGKAGRGGVKPAAPPAPARLGHSGSAAVKLAPVPPPAPRTEWRLRLRARTWLMAAAGTGLLIAGGVLGALVRSTQRDFNDTALPASTDAAAMRHYVALADKGKTYALGANVCFGAGAAALAVGGILFGFDWHQVAVQPVAGPRGAGLTLRRSF